MHAPELPDAKCFASPAGAFLAEEHRAAAIELDGQRNGQQHRRCKQQDQRRQYPVLEVLEEQAHARQRRFRQGQYGNAGNFPYAVVDQAQRENIRHPVHRNALVEQLEIHVVDDLGTAQRGYQIHRADAVASHDIVEFGNMPEHRHALLAFGAFAPWLIGAVDQHAPQHTLAEPRVVADFLVQEVGQVAGADDQGVVQARMGGEALLQFTHGKVQEQLGDVANDEQLHDQQPRIGFTLFGQEGHDHQEAKGYRPGLEQPESLDGKADIGTVDRIVVVDDCQGAHQQQQHDHVIRGDVAKLVVDQVPGDTGDCNPI